MPIYHCLINSKTKIFLDGIRLAAVARKLQNDRSSNVRTLIPAGRTKKIVIVTVNEKSFLSY